MDILVHSNTLNNTSELNVYYGNTDELVEVKMKHQDKMTIERIIYKALFTNQLVITDSELMSRQSGNV